MEAMEKYSVLMSVYKKEKPEYLKAAIDSMTAQTARPDEIVIVKDGPLTAELEAVLEACSTAFPGLFRIVGYEENKGLGYALNYGMARTRNELVARMDSDDLSLPGRIREQLDYLKAHPETDVVGGDIAEFIGEPGNIVGKRVVPRENEALREYIKRRCPLNHMTVLYKKSEVMRAGGYQDWFCNEDYYLWIRMYLQGSRFANTGTVLVNARVGEEMYQRRGGKRYFDSEIGLQKLMLEKKVITLPVYIENCAKRWIIQRLLPNKLRGLVFRKFAREN